MSGKGQQRPKHLSQGKVSYGTRGLIWGLKKGKGLDEKKVIKAFPHSQNGMFRDSVTCAQSF